MFFLKHMGMQAVCLYLSKDMTEWSVQPALYIPMYLALMAISDSYILYLG